MSNKQAQQTPEGLCQGHRVCKTRIVRRIPAATDPLQERRDAVREIEYAAYIPRRGLSRYTGPIVVVGVLAAVYCGLSLFDHRTSWQDWLRGGCLLLLPFPVGYGIKRHRDWGDILNSKLHDYVPYDTVVYDALHHSRLVDGHELGDLGHSDVFKWAMAEFRAIDIAEGAEVADTAPGAAPASSAPPMNLTRLRKKNERHFSEVEQHMIDDVRVIAAAFTKHPTLFE